MSYRPTVRLTPDQILNLFDYPLGYPPSDVTPNFDNSPSNGSQVYVYAGICLSLILFAATCRVANRLQTKRNGFTLSDFLILYSVFGVILRITLAIFDASGKCWGRHVWDVKLRFSTQAQVILATATPLLYVWNTLTIQIALSLLYLEMFGSKKWLRIWSYVGMVVWTILHVAFILAWCISCRPRGGHSQASFVAGMMSPRCSSGIDYLVLLSVTTMAGDIFLFTLPLPAIWSLRTKIKKNPGDSAMFLSGLSAVAGGIATLVYRIKLTNSTDATWDALDNWATSMCEMTAGIIVVCLPSIEAIVRSLVSQNSLLSAGHKPSSIRTSSTGSSATQRLTSGFRPHMGRSTASTSESGAEKSIRKTTTYSVQGVDQPGQETNRTVS